MKDEKGFEIVPIELSDEDTFTLMKIAHERDITFNQLCNDILRGQIQRFEKNQEELQQLILEHESCEDGGDEDE